MLKEGEMKRIGILLVCMMLVPMVVGADLTIEEKTYFRAPMGMWTTRGTEVTYIKGDKMRTESKEERTGMMATMPKEEALPAVAIIIRLDKKVMWHLNLADRTYMEMPLDGGKKEDMGEEFDFGLKDLKVKKTGETKEIMGQKCQEVKAEVTFESKFGEEGETISQKVDLLFWMSPKGKALKEMRRFWENMIEMGQGGAQGYPLGDAMKELWEELGKEGEVPLAMEMSMGGVGMDPEEEAEMKEAMQMMKQYMKGGEGEEAEEGEREAEDGGMKITREITSISEDKLDESLFEIPEGFKQSQ
jgi:hypothetical protein